MSGLIVHMTDVRSSGLCARGAKQWFERHGLDFKKFLLEGYPIEVIEGTGDALGKLVADKVRARAAGEDE